MGLIPRSIGYQDLVALMAQQSEVSQRARAHMMASPFGTIHAATFSFPQPVGTQIPDPPWSSSPASAPTIRDHRCVGADPFGNARESAQDRCSNFRRSTAGSRATFLVNRPRDNESPPAGGTRDLTPAGSRPFPFPKPSDVTSRSATRDIAGR
jgi:hypothetical protein